MEWEVPSLPLMAASTSTPVTNPVLVRMGELLGTPIASEVDVVLLVRYGLTADMWTRLNSQCPLPPDLFVPNNSARLIAALGRRFTPAETDPILRATRVIAQAWQALGSLSAARSWLETRAELLPGYPPTPPWALAACDAGARLCQSLLGMGSAITAACPAVAQSAAEVTNAVDVNALLRDQAQMTGHDLDWALALEEQRSAALPEVEAAAAPAGVDVDALIADVAVDVHDALWAEAMAEQRASEKAGDPAGATDADALLADVAGQSPNWQIGASADQVVCHTEHEGLVPSKAA